MACDSQLAERIREHVSREKNLTEKAMFGGLAFLINGRMAVAAGSKGGLMLRVDPAQTDALLQLPHARPFEMRGRDLNGWLLVEGDLSDEELGEWIGRGIAYAKSLPPK